MKSTTCTTPQSSFAKMKRLITLLAVSAFTALILITRSTFAADALPQIGALPAAKVLFLGNSITLHGPKPDIGWTGNWGMAATAEAKDYVHLLTAGIARSAGGAPQILVRNIAGFERGYSSFDIGAELKDVLAFRADIVVLAIGENVPEPADDEARGKFATAFARLLATLTENGKPAIFVRSCFWPHEVKDGIMRKATADAGATWVDIAALGRDESNAARSERKIDHAGVAGHPGDKGMRAIADALFSALKKRAGAPGNSALIPPPEKLALWPDQAPVGDGKMESVNAFITVFHPAKANGAAVVICPGGGYGGLVTGPEGSGIAQWLNAHGVTGIVLEYRLPRGRAFVPLLDAQRALRTVRTKAAAWGCDPQRIGIIGFSAGGHLASTAATHFDVGNAAATDPIERASSRPDFAVLVYPVISMGEKSHGGSKQNLLGPNPSAELADLFSNEKQVTAQTSPTYLAHAVDDRAVSIENSRMFHEALKAKGVATQCLELPSGDHGLNGYQGPMWNAWQSGALKWLASLKLIPERDADSPR